MFYIFFFLLLINDSGSANETSKRPTSTITSHRKKTFAAIVFSGTNNISPCNKKPCNWLSRLKHQNRICWKRKGLPEVLLNARNLSITACQNQFEFDQWNCSKRDSFFKNIYRESAFMYAIASSAVTFSVARACSEGTLAGCQCGKINNLTKFQWEGCSDNVKYAKKFTRKFLQLWKKDMNPIVKYNAEIGLKVVAENEKVICRCHGVSGSCRVKICFKRIQSFEVITKQLKALYHSAIKVHPENSVRPYKRGKSARKLLYLESSPNFCPTTVNRVCVNTENCATLCCGRGFYTDYVQEVDSKCMCRWRSDKFDVECDSCKKNRTIFTCK